MTFGLSEMSTFEEVCLYSPDITQLHNIVVIFDSPAIYDLIFSCLPPLAVIYCSRTCRLLYRACKDFNQRSYNITKHLAYFFNNPSWFRSIQASTGAVISGSNAIQFFDRSFYDTSDLDIFVGQSFAMEIARWLIESEGYFYRPFGSDNADIAKSLTFTPIGRNDINGRSLHSHEYRGTGMSRIFEFLREGNKKIQLITTIVSPLHCILSFHSTCVMNFITFEGAYSLYPIATFQNRETITVGPVGEREGRALAKYAIRGWTVYAGNWDDNTLRRVLFFDKRRHILDRHTWIIQFDTKDVMLRQPPTLSSIPFTSDPSQYNSWVLLTRPITHMQFQIIASNVLIHNYVIATESEFKDINGMLQRQENFESLKIQNIDGEDLKNEASTYWDGLYARWCAS